MKGILTFIFLCLLLAVFSKTAFAQKVRVNPTLAVDKTLESTISATASATVIEKITPVLEPRPDLTQETKETLEPLRKLLQEQKIGSITGNPLKHAIRGAVEAGVPPNRIVLLLLLPAVATLIAAARHLIGLRGFGIFLPAALSVVFVATGPLVGILLFLIIVLVSTASRITMRRLKLKLQYLPRMALILLFVVCGILLVLFSTPIIRRPDLVNVSIFPVLILVLLAEEFSKVQLGKSVKVAINLTSETLILALFSYFFLTTRVVQQFALLNPEIWLFLIFLFDILMGRYVGLRFLEYWRFRKLITK